MCIIKGLVLRDLVKAAEYYGKAANLGHIHAQCNLAIAYQEGLGTRQDLNRLAFERYGKAAAHAVQSSKYV